LILILLFLGVFGEHKKIGDEAFKRFIESDKRRLIFFRDSLGYDIINQDILFFSDQISSFQLTYGDFSGLSGDHTINPLSLIFQLKNNSSKMSKTLKEQLDAIMSGKNAASDLDLSLIDIVYPFRAIFDKSHFYAPKISIKNQLVGLDELMIENLRNEYYNVLDKTLKDLLTIESVKKYAILNLIALDMIYYAGFLYTQPELFNKAQALDLIKTAFLFNAFADHFLQDAFSSGHLLVKRSYLTALDNKGRHDFYGRVGLNVSNEHESWKAYGDNNMANSSDFLENAFTANFNSIMDLWNTFEQSRNNLNQDSPLRLYAESKEKADWLYTNFSSFKLWPNPEKIAEQDLGNSRNGAIYSIGTTYLSANKEVYPLFKMALGVIGEVPEKDVLEKESLSFTSIFFSTTILETQFKTSFGLEKLFQEAFRFSLGYSNILSDHTLLLGTGFDYKPISSSFGFNLDLSAYSNFSYIKPAINLTLSWY
jgi:hypothetical protein